MSIPNVEAARLTAVAIKGSSEEITPLAMVTVPEHVPDAMQ